MKRKYHNISCDLSSDTPKKRCVFLEVIYNEGWFRIHHTKNLWSKRDGSFYVFFRDINLHNPVSECVCSYNSLENKLYLNRSLCKDGFHGDELEIKPLIRFGVNGDTYSLKFRNQCEVDFVDNIPLLNEAFDKSTNELSKKQIYKFFQSFRKGRVGFLETSSLFSFLNRNDRSALVGFMKGGLKKDKIKNFNK